MDRLLKKLKPSQSIIITAIFVYTLLMFFLDLSTGREVHFYIFYFPSVVCAAWFFKKKWAYAFAFFVVVLWFVAQWEWHPDRGNFVFFWNGMIRFLTFLFVTWAVLKIRSRTLELEQLSEELKRSNSELEQFAFKAAHDLQSPLSTIFSYAEYLGELAKNEKQERIQNASQQILKSIKRMVLMVKELLNYSRAMKEESSPEPVDLNEVLKDVLENIRSLREEKEAVVNIGSLPKIPINRGLALLLFQNLIGNALKYCEQTPQIHVEGVRKGKEWLFSVRDNGIGIPAEDRSRVFIMFEKLPTRCKYPGSGIGLATCQKIVERCKGRIWVEAAPGGGSIFYFTLPLK